MTTEDNPLTHIAEALVEQAGKAFKAGGVLNPNVRFVDRVVEIGAIKIDENTLTELKKHFASAADDVGKFVHRVLDASERTMTAGGGSPNCTAHTFAVNI